MTGYVLRRLTLFIPTLILTTMIIFVIMRVAPGDVARLVLGGVGGENRFTEAEVLEVRTRLGLDKPLVVQYVDWLRQMVMLDFGESLYGQSPVFSDVMKRWLDVTVEITLLSMVFSVLLAIPSGVLQAFKRDSRWDYLLRFITIGGVAMPAFLVGMLMLLVSVRVFGWIPPLQYRPFWDDPFLNLQQVVMPSLALGYLLSASITRMIRSSTLEVLQQDYVRTARAKGLTSRQILVRHALRNALLPVITLSGMQLGGLLGGSVITETLFNLPGVGRTLIQAIEQRDYPVVQFIVMLFSFQFLVINLVVDLMYAVLDPRIRYS